MDGFLPVELELDIESPAAGGTSIARYDGQVVFVAGAIPGERVRVQTVKGSSAKFLRAKVTEVISPSPFRVPDRRANYLPVGVSVTDNGFGGMDYAHVDLAHSRLLKADILKDQLIRIAHIDRDITVEAAPGESDGTEWRTRIQLAIDAQGRPGMLESGSHTVVPVSSVPLACPEIAAAGLPNMRLAGASRLEAAWAGDHGALIVRGDPGAAALAEVSVSMGPEWSILAETGTSGSSGARSGGRRSRGQRSGSSDPLGRLGVVRGSDELRQRVGGREFRVAADGFWQVHRAAPKLLSGLVTEAIEPSVTSITDLYCGVGLLGIGAATAHDASLFGVEGSKSAIHHARRNAQGLAASFEAVRADRAELPKSEAIILDPPRSGAGKAVNAKLIASSANTVVYVSCDQATLARDLLALTAGGFEIESLRGFDLFPLTAHMETVTVLRR